MSLLQRILLISHVVLNLYSSVLGSISSGHIDHAHPDYRAFVGGLDIDGERLYVCRVFRFGQILPGKFSNSLRKCSVTHNGREAQFYRFELLVLDTPKSAMAHYEWVPVKAPATKLPENVLFGGNRYATQLMMMMLSDPSMNTTTTNRETPIHLSKNLTNKHRSNGVLLFRGDEINPDIWNHLLTPPNLVDWSLRKRKRTRRSVVASSSLRNQRRSRVSSNVVSECPDSNPQLSRARSANHNKTSNAILSDPFGAVILPRRIECMQNPDPQKLNFYIAKCQLRSGETLSEQLGAIRWLEPAQQWIATFPFGGHEIECLDFSVLALRPSSQVINK